MVFSFVVVAVVERQLKRIARKNGSIRKEPRVSSSRYVNKKIAGSL